MEDRPPYGFIVRIYPGFCRPVYNRKLNFPKHFPPIVPDYSERNFQGISAVERSGYVVQRIIDFRAVLFAVRYTQLQDILVSSILSCFLFLGNYRFVVSI